MSNSALRAAAQKVRPALATKVNPVPTRLRAASSFLTLIALASLGFEQPSTRPASVSPQAVGVSQPVPVEQVEDAAIWVHPTDPAGSLLLVANKAHGVEIHRPDGLLLKHYADGTQVAGIDVLYDVPMGDKGPVDVAVAACQTDQADGLRVWRVDPAKSKLAELTVPTKPLPVMGAEPPLGVCGYHSRRTGKSYVFVTAAGGLIEQHELTIASDGTVALTKVRAFDREGKVKGVVADDEAGVLYVAQEKTGVFRMGAEPTDALPAADAEPVVRLGENGLIPDLTGLALYCGTGGRGYLLVVSQGPRGTPSHVAVYDRQSPNEFVLNITPAAGAYSVPYGSSGIAVTNRPCGPRFPQGFLAIKDRFDAEGVEKYKLFAWPDIAGPGRLLIDPAWSPRGKR